MRRTLGTSRAGRFHACKVVKHDCTATPTISAKFQGFHKPSARQRDPQLTFRLSDVHFLVNCPGPQVSGLLLRCSSPGQVESTHLKPKGHRPRGGRFWQGVEIAPVGMDEALPDTPLIPCMVLHRFGRSKFVDGSEEKLTRTNP